MKKNTIITITIIVVLVTSLTLRIIYKPNNNAKTNEESTNSFTLNNYSFKFDSEKDAKKLKMLITKNEDYNVYYYQRDIYLSLCENNKCYDIKEALDKKYTTLNDILSKSNKKSESKEGNKIYYYDKFNIVECDKTIYIGNSKLEIDVCK